MRNHHSATLGKGDLPLSQLLTAIHEMKGEGGGGAAPSTRLLSAPCHG
jgi:hypothetical protein